MCCIASAGHWHCVSRLSAAQPVPQEILPGGLLQPWHHRWDGPCGRPPAAADAAASPALWTNGAWRVGAACWSRCLAPGQRQRLPLQCESFNEQNFPKMDSLLAITDDYCFITSSLLPHYFLLLQITSIRSGWNWSFTAHYCFITAWLLHKIIH